MTLTQLNKIDTVKTYASLNEADKMQATIMDGDLGTLEIGIAVVMGDYQKYFAIGEYSYDDSVQAYDDFHTLKRIVDLI